MATNVPAFLWILSVQKLNTKDSKVYDVTNQTDFGLISIRIKIIQKVALSVFLLNFVLFL